MPLTLARLSFTRLPLARVIRPLTLVLALGLPATGAVLQAAEAQDPLVKKRIALMQGLKADAGLLGDMAAGKRPFDAAAAAEAAAALTANADLIEPAFDTPADDPESDALPDIWNSPAEFRQKADRLYKAAMELETEDPGAIAASMNALNAACKDCHGRFKM